MYTITFYSFKGGVGRTFALVNVGAELARRGRRVLLVDFDLEAPGLETFERLRPAQPHPGVVEYVTEFLRTWQTPDVRPYVYPAGAIGENNGRLWIMPAGRRDLNYQAGLVKIDWKQLFRGDAKGEELFKETKKQWEEEFKPDYVLIDSRTGHTDVGEICTRLLPDAVVVLFFPNEQNLVGLKDVCRRIRGEHERHPKKIRLHFVMSNVPDLDDEDGHLHQRQEAFQKELGFREPDVVIHRYESVLLFNQAVFVLDRPNSRLAGEYRQLAEKLMVQNPADREGALHFLHQYAQSYLPSVPGDVGSEMKRKLAIPEESPLVPTSPRSTDLQRRRGYKERTGEAKGLKKIIENFLDDPEVLLRAAECRTLEGDYKAAEKLLDRVLQVKPDFAAALFERAFCKNLSGDREGAADDLVKYLNMAGLDRSGVLAALRQLHAVAPNRLVDVVDLPALQALDAGGLFEVSDLLSESEPGLARALQLQPERTDLLVLAGRWEEAIDQVQAAALDDANRFFDLAMADWGKTGHFSKDLCRSALKALEVSGQAFDLDPPTRQAFDQDPSTSTFMEAFVLWGVGEKEEALRKVDQTIATSKDRGAIGSAFSPWRYRRVTLDQFLEDCQQFRRMVQGEPVRPAFLGKPGAPDGNEATTTR